MGEIGDYWREHREHRQRVRSTWNQCWRCGRKYSPEESSETDLCGRCKEP